MAEQVVLVERDEAVAVVTMNRPEKRNALSPELMRLLRSTISELDQDDEIRAIVLTGADPAFCAGVDLAQFEDVLQGSVGTPEGGSAPFLGMLPRRDTPVIGAINGATATGGLEVALDCDFLIASERARFADTHARVGVMPGGGLTVRLPRLIGIDRARRMSLTGDFIDAPTALAWGLVTELTAHDQLLVRAWSSRAPSPASSRLPSQPCGPSTQRPRGSPATRPTWRRSPATIAGWRSTSTPAPSPSGGPASSSGARSRAERLSRSARHRPAARRCASAPPPRRRAPPRCRRQGWTAASRSPRAWR